jgi:hypothetical protein
LKRTHLKKQSSCSSVLCCVVAKKQDLCTQASEAHIYPHDAHIISMNIGGVVPLSQGDEIASGPSSEEESVTSGGVSLRAIEVCRCQQIYVDSGNDKKTLFLLFIGLNVNNGDAFT